HDGSAPPLPLAGEGWGGGASASGFPAWREPPPAALFERVGLPRERERRSKPAGFTQPSQSHPASGRRKFARGERGAMVVDGRRPGEPHLFPLWMADDVLQRLAEHAKPVGLTYDHRVQCDAAYQRLFCRLAQQFLELTNDEVTEFFRRVMPHQNLRAVVDLDRVRDAH